jgi:hypothetical protein
MSGKLSVRQSSSSASSSSKTSSKPRPQATTGANLNLSVRERILQSQSKLKSLDDAGRLSNHACRLDMAKPSYDDDGAGKENALDKRKPVKSASHFKPLPLTALRGEVGSTKRGRSNGFDEVVAVSPLKSALRRQSSSPSSIADSGSSKKKVAFSLRLGRADTSPSGSEQLHGMFALPVNSAQHYH